MNQNSPSSSNLHWHTLSIEDVCDRLETSLKGLTQEEAQRRFEQYGPNQLEASGGVSPWAIFIGQFKNVLIVILLLATVFSAFVGHAIEAAAIAVIVLFAVLLGFLQEFRAEQAIEALNSMAAPKAKVVRQGEEVIIEARNLVPGDVILLRVGDRIAADARIVQAVNMMVDEAALTGESVPVEKQADQLQESGLVIGDQSNRLFAGTSVSYGRGKAIVVATGMETEFGRIAGMLQSIESGTTPLKKNLDKVGRRLAQAAFVVVALIVILGVIQGRPVMEIVIFGIALAVAVVPEALPAVVTISLAIGVQRMVTRNALVRRLQAVETLGSTSVICSDKTGTLTKDEMTVRRMVVDGQTWEVTGAGYDPHGEFLENAEPVNPPESVHRLFEGAVLSSDATLARDDVHGLWTIEGDPTEGALVVAGAKLGIEKDEIDARLPRIDEIPFTSESKRMTTLHKTDGGLVAYAKGAPEVIVEACTSQMCADGSTMPIDEASREEILMAASLMANDALRVLAVASRSVADRQEAEQKMTLLGLVGMIDPPRPEVKEAVRSCVQAGIRPVMITGDHPTTAEAIARELGILKRGRTVTGKELETMADSNYRQQIEEIEVYARVSPAHKLRIVTMLQEKGHVVAMTGDGINDAPALKKADIGIAMGITGTDVTKEAAAMALTDDNFASIVAAIEEGRIVFGNIKKYLMYLLSANVGEIGLMAGASLGGLPLPLTAVQLLYVNLATDGLPALALAIDPPESDLMKRKPRNPNTGVFTSPVVFLMLLAGFWSMVINLGLFSWALNSGRSLNHAMSMTFSTLVVIEFLKAYNFRSDHLSVFNRPFANRWLNLAICWELLLLIAILYIPFLQSPFRTSGLTQTDWLIVLSLALTIVPVIELGKWGMRRGWVGSID